MTPRGGDDFEMREPEHPLSVDDVDRLIDGQLVLGNEGVVRSLASQIDDLRLTYRAPAEGIPVDQLAARAMTEARLIRSEKGDPAATPASNANRPAPQVSGLPTTRRRPVLESILAFLATTAGKAAVAAALVGTAATGGLIATDNLPLPGDDDTAAVTTADADIDEGEGDEIEDVDDDADDPDPCEGLTGVAEARCEADQECTEARAEVPTEDDDQTEAQLEADQECAEAQAELAEAEREAAEEAAEAEHEAAETQPEQDEDGVDDDKVDDDEIDEVESDDEIDEVDDDEIEEVEVEEVDDDAIEVDEVDEVESDDDPIDEEAAEPDDDEDSDESDSDDDVEESDDEVDED